MECSDSNGITVITDIVIPILTVIVSIILAYLSVRWTIKDQYSKGKYQLFEIVNRYFINAYNSVDITKVPPCTKTNPIDKIYQLEELKAIHQDLAKLFDNPYYLDLLKKYPELSMINLKLRREIIDLDKADKVALQPDNIDTFYTMYKNIRKEIPQRLIRKNPAFKEIDILVEGLNTSMEQHKTKNKNK